MNQDDSGNENSPGIIYFALNSDSSDGHNGPVFVSFRSRVLIQPDRTQTDSSADANPERPTLHHWISSNSSFLSTLFSLPQEANEDMKRTSQRCIDNLPHVDLADLEVKTCAICFDDYEELPQPAAQPAEQSDPANKAELSQKPTTHQPRRLPCGHVFGDSCIKEWLRSNVTCPMCRSKLETHHQYLMEVNGGDSDRRSDDETLSAPQRMFNRLAFMQSLEEVASRRRTEDASEYANNSHEPSDSDSARSSLLDRLTRLARSHLPVVDFSFTAPEVIRAEQSERERERAEREYGDNREPAAASTTDATQATSTASTNSTASNTSTASLSSAAQADFDSQLPLPRITHFQSWIDRRNEYERMEGETLDGLASGSDNTSEVPQRFSLPPFNNLTSERQHGPLGRFWSADTAADTTEASDNDQLPADPVDVAPTPDEPSAGAGSTESSIPRSTPRIPADYASSNSLMRRNSPRSSLRSTAHRRHFTMRVPIARHPADDSDPRPSSEDASPTPRPHICASHQFATCPCIVPPNESVERNPHAVALNCGHSFHKPCLRLASNGGPTDSSSERDTNHVWCPLCVGYRGIRHPGTTG